MSPTEGAVRVLVVDDDPLIRHAAKMILQHEGFDVVEASSGNEAQRAYRAKPTDVIVCDLFMPEKDGLETIREILEEFPSAKIIAMSGGAYHGKLDVMQVARALGAIEGLIKPFEPRELFDAIDRALQRIASKS